MSEDRLLQKQLKAFVSGTTKFGWEIEEYMAMCGWFDNEAIDYTLGIFDIVDTRTDLCAD